MRLTRISLVSNKGLSVRIDNFPKDLSDAYNQCDLVSFQRTFLTLKRQGGVSPAVLPAALFLGTELSAKNNNIALVFEYSKELLRMPEIENSYYLSTLDILCDALVQAKNISHPEYPRISQELNKFFTQEIVSQLPAKPVNEQCLWLNLIGLHIQGRLQYKLDLCERIFNQTSPGDDKLLSVLIYLNLCTMEFKKNPKFQINSPLAKQMAAYYVEDQKQAKEKNLGQFNIMLANFGYLGLVEEMAAAIESWNLPQDHLAREALLLLSTHREYGAKAAFALIDLHGDTHQKTEKGQIIENFLRWLWIKLAIEVYQQKTIMPPTAVACYKQGNCYSLFLQKPRQDHPEITSAVKDLRAKILEILTKQFNHFETSFFYSFPFETEAGKMQASVIWGVGGDALYVYLFDKTSDQSIKAYFEAKNNSGEVKVKSGCYFDAVAKEDQGKVMLFWEMAVLEIIVETLLNGVGVDDRTRSRVKYEIGQITEKVRVQANRLFQELNNNSFAAFLEEFSRVAGYRDLAIKAENQARVLLQILERCSPEFVEIKTALCPTDFLSPLLDTIHIFRGEKYFEELKQSAGFSESDLQAIKKGSKNGFPLLVSLKPKQGQEFRLIFTEHEKVRLAGTNQELDPLLSKFVVELVLHTLVGSLRINVDEEKKPQTMTDPPGYIIDEQGALNFPGSAPASSLQRLMDIYNVLFFQRMMKSGVMGEPWYEYVPNAEGTDGVYRPFEDQSVKNKQALLAQYKADKLFVSSEPHGIITRLPLGVKRQGKERVIAPLERGALREEQQRYFKDYRPLPHKHALYIITEFEDRKKKRFFHLFPVAFSDDMDEMIDLACSDEFNADLASGKYKKPKMLFSKTEATKAKQLTDLLAKRKIRMVDQTVSTYTLNYTYRRPQFSSVESYLEKGFRLGDENDPQ